MNKTVGMQRGSVPAGAVVLSGVPLPSWGHGPCLETLLIVITGGGVLLASVG